MCPCGHRRTRQNKLRMPFDCRIATAAFISSWIDCSSRESTLSRQLRPGNPVAHLPTAQVNGAPSICSVIQLKFAADVLYTVRRSRVAAGKPVCNHVIFTVSGTGALPHVNRVLNVETAFIRITQTHTIGLIFQIPTVAAARSRSPSRSPAAIVVCWA